MSEQTLPRPSLTPRHGDGATGRLGEGTHDDPLATLHSAEPEQDGGTRVAASPRRPVAVSGVEVGSGGRRFEPVRTNRIRSARVAIAVLVVAAAIGYLIYNGFQSTTVYYLTVSELKAKGPAAGAVRVAGIVQDNTVQRSTEDATVRFTIADGGGSLPVVYKGMVPDIFGPGIQVVVEGHYTADGVFQANTLLAKCPSKFTAAVPTPVKVQ